MAYLDHDNNSIIVDAVLTKRGREILAEGNSNFSVTKFALADDEVNYELWNPLHPDGSDAYGSIIENMPCLEANVDQDKTMRWKLTTQNKITITIANIVGELMPDIGSGDGILPTNLNTIITPTTSVDGIDSTIGYTIIADTNQFVEIIPIEAALGGDFEGNDFGGGVISNTNNDGIIDLADHIVQNSSTGVVAKRLKSFKIRGRLAIDGPNITNITILGNESGATYSFIITTGIGNGYSPPAT